MLVTVQVMCTCKVAYLVKMRFNFCLGTNLFLCVLGLSLSHRATRAVFLDYVVYRLLRKFRGLSHVHTKGNG